MYEMRRGIRREEVSDEKWYASRKDIGREEVTDERARGPVGPGIAQSALSGAINSPLLLIVSVTAGSMDNKTQNLI
jgi:hypothetical protein